MKTTGSGFVRSPEVTYRIMSAVKSKDTRPELILRKSLWSKGLRYRVNVKSLPGKPDIVFSRAKIAVFCDGDFWHGNNWAIRGMRSLDDELERYSQFWKEKILGNIERDIANTSKLRADGWEVIRIWESDIKADVEKCVSVISKAYNDAIESINEVLS